MSLPTLNEIGYASSRLSTKATNLKGKKFLLVHGTLDDNVHYQQAMILAKNLERHDILFKQIVSIRGAGRGTLPEAHIKIRDRRGKSIFPVGNWMEFFRSYEN